MANYCRFSTKLVQNKLLPGSSKARSLKNSSDEDDDDVRLSPIRIDKKPRTSAANGKPASGKLLLASTKLFLGIGQDVRAKKLFTLNIG